MYILYSTRVRINRRMLFIYLHYFASPLVVGFVPDGSLAQLNVKSKNPIRQPPGLSCVFIGHFHRYGHSRLFLSTSIWAIFSRPTSASFDIPPSSATGYVVEYHRRALDIFFSLGHFRGRHFISVLSGLNGDGWREASMSFLKIIIV